MESSIIDDEEEHTDVSGRLTFNQSDKIEEDNSSLNPKPLKLSQHFNLDRDKTSSKTPIFGSGKTWLSKISSAASSSSTRGSKKYSFGQSDGDVESASSPSKPIGHWPDLLVMDNNENIPTLPPTSINGKN